MVDREARCEALESYSVGGEAQSAALEADIPS